MTEAVDFPVTWLDPSDAELTWEWDDMHMPAALTPLAGDYVLTMGSGFAYGYERLGVPAEIRTRVWNGYAYFALATDVPESERPAMWERRKAAARARIPHTDAYWREVALPELRGIYAWVAARPVETMPAAELAETWDEVWTRIARCWSIHFYAIRGPYQVLDDLADLYESIVENATPGEALALIGGGIDELQDVERRLEALTAQIAATPGLAERLVEPGMTIADLAGSPDAEPFVPAWRRSSRSTVISVRTSTTWPSPHGRKSRPPPRRAREKGRTTGHDRSGRASRSGLPLRQRHWPAGRGPRSARIRRRGATSTSSSRRRARSDR